MMDTIRQWAAVICIVLILTAVLAMLIPHSKSEKVMQFSLGLFFILCLLLPFSKRLPDFDLAAYAADAVDTTRIEEQMREQIIDLSEANLRRVVEQVLEEEGYTAKKIETNINISEDDSISITKIILELDDDDQKNVQSVRGLVEEKLGIETQVVTSSER